MVPTSTTFSIESSALIGSIHVHRDVFLLERSATLRMQVVASLTGAPAVGAMVDLDNWVFPASGHRLDDPMVAKSVRADSQGVVLLADLPATTVTVSVRPYERVNFTPPRGRTRAAVARPGR